MAIKYISVTYHSQYQEWGSHEPGRASTRWRVGGGGLRARKEVSHGSRCISKPDYPDAQSDIIKVRGWPEVGRLEGLRSSAKGPGHQPWSCCTEPGFHIKVGFGGQDEPLQRQHSGPSVAASL